MFPTVEIRDVLVDITVSGDLIHKEREIEQKHRNVMDQITQTAKPVVQSEAAADKEAHIQLQSQNEQDETDVLNANSVQSSPSSSGIVSDNTSNLSTSDTVITEEREECAK